MAQKLHGNPSFRKGEDRRGSIPLSATPGPLRSCRVSIGLEGIVASRILTSQTSEKQNGWAKDKFQASNARRLFSHQQSVFSFLGVNRILIFGCYDIIGSGLYVFIGATIDEKKVDIQ